MTMNRDEIAKMIPHEGAMVLLDEVLFWDAESVRCASRRYAAADNPLRRADGTLGTASGIEIAAQAMAVHGRLTAANTARPAQGYLASLRDIRLGAVQLDAHPGEIIIEATRLMGDSRSATYHFSLTRDGAELLSGRATVLLDITA